MALRVDDVDLLRDRSLVERAQAGDGAAFAELYARYFARLSRFCERRLGDAHDAEEAAQEAFTRAYFALDRLGGERRFYPWLSVIAARVCVDVHRRRARIQPASDLDPGAVDGGIEDIVRSADAAEVRAAMARLAPRHQEILRLREWEGWSYRRLAEHLEMTMAGTEALLWRARQALRRELERAHPEGRWAGLPVVGWLVRRLAAARTARTARPAVRRVSGQVAGVTGASSVNLGPIVGGVLSAAVAGALVLGAVALPQVPPARVPTVQLPPGAAVVSHPSEVAPAAPGQAVTAVPSSRATNPPADVGAPLASARVSGAAPAAEGARQQPVHTSVAGTDAGVDPRATLADALATVASTNNLELRGSTLDVRSPR